MVPCQGITHVACSTSRWVLAWGDICATIADGLSYWEDVTHTLSAFVEVFPPSAGLLLQSHGLLLVQLILVHSGLIPDLQRGLAASLGQSPAAAKVSYSSLGC